MNKFALHNKDLVKILMFISKIFNTKYKVVFLPIFSYISGNNNKERLVILVNYIVFELLVIFIKDLLKTDRPCLGQSGCPNYYDIPSGHSFGGIYFYLLLKNREYDENDNEFLKLSRKILLPILILRSISWLFVLIRFTLLYFFFSLSEVMSYFINWSIFTFNLKKSFPIMNPESSKRNIQYF